MADLAVAVGVRTESGQARRPERSLSQPCVEGIDARIAFSPPRGWICMGPKRAAALTARLACRPFARFKTRPYAVTGD